MVVAELAMQIPCDSSDDPAFIALVERALGRSAAFDQSQFIHLVKVDGWFGDRWLGFSGKFLGAAGVRGWRLTIPPFHPHRIIREARFRTADSQWVAFDKPLHVLRTSQSNLGNYVEQLGPSMTLGWFSGDTQSSGRGAIMVYRSTPHGATGWYVGLERGEAWRITKRIGIDPREWDMLIGVRSDMA